MRIRIPCFDENVKCEIITALGSASFGHLCFPDEPVITHGLTLTSKIRFRDVVQVIKVIKVFVFNFIPNDLSLGQIKVLFAVKLLENNSLIYKVKVFC